MNRLLAFLFIALSISFGQTTLASSMKRILVLGDSLSEGFGLKPSQAYPPLLTEKLRVAGLSFEITNASQNGGTTEEGLARLPRHLKPIVDIFILELGVNDAFRNLPIDQIRANLQEMIDRVRGTNPNVRIFICGMQLPNHPVHDYVSAFGQMYSELAVKNNAALLPYILAGVAGDPRLTLPDHLHPNAEGQKILAENVWRVLEPIAREVATGKSTTRVK
jgi:acyl-CoA thioesterase I